MPLRRICAGYVGADEVTHPCGAFSGMKPSPNEGTTHGFCSSCEQKALKALGLLKEAHDK